MHVIRMVPAALVPADKADPADLAPEVDSPVVDPAADSPVVVDRNHKNKKICMVYTPCRFFL